MRWTAVVAFAAGLFLIGWSILGPINAISGDWPWEAALFGVLFAAVGVAACVAAVWLWRDED